MSFGKVVAVILVLALIGGLYAYSTYGSLISKEQNTKKAWSNVESQYQRRADLIPRMVNVVETSAKFQMKFVEGYAEKREGLSAADMKYKQAVDKMDINNPKSLENAENAWNDVKNQYGGLTINMRSEAVPQANLDQFTELNNEMAAIENVIAGKRDAYTDAATDYNNYVLMPPTSNLASYWGFPKYIEPFHAQKGAENAPTVNMNISI